MDLTVVDTATGAECAIDADPDETVGSLKAKAAARLLATPDSKHPPYNPPPPPHRTELALAGCADAWLDGDTLLADLGIETGGKIELQHDYANAKCPCVYRCGDFVWSLSVSPCGKWLAAGLGDGSVRVWDTETGDAAERLVISTLRSVIGGIAFSPCSAWLACGSHDSILVFSHAAGSGALQRSFRHDVGALQRLVVSRAAEGSRVIAAAAGSSIAVLCFETGLPLKSFPGNDVSISSCGGYLATCHSNQVMVYRVDGFQVHCSINFPVEDTLGVALSPRGGHIAVNSHHTRLYVVDVATGELVSADSNTGSCIVFSPCGLWVATVSADPVLWQASSLVPRVVVGGAAEGRGGCGRGARAVAFSPCGRCVYVGSSSDLAVHVVHTPDVEGGGRPE